MVAGAGRFVTVPSQETSVRPLASASTSVLCTSLSDHPLRYRFAASLSLLTMTPSNGPVNGLPSTLIELLETPSTKLVQRGRLPLFTSCLEEVFSEGGSQRYADLCEHWAVPPSEPVLTGEACSHLATRSNRFLPSPEPTSPPGPALYSLLWFRGDRGDCIDRPLRGRLGSVSWLWCRPPNLS